MKPRKPIQRSRKPISRGTTQLKRKPIKRGLGRVGKLRADNAIAAKRHYFQHFGQNGIAPCQWSGWVITEDNCTAHHKRKRSLGGSDQLSNYLILNNLAHQEIHSTQQNLKTAELSPANAENGQRVAK